MNTTVDSLARAMEKDFKGCSRAELEAFANQIGVEFHPNIGDERLRARMLEKLGREVTEIPDDSDAPEEVSGPAPETDGEEMSLSELMALNLTPNGKWEGRRRMLSIVRPENYKGNHPHPFRWVKHLCMVPYNKAVSVPYPIYNIIKDAEYKELNQVRTTGKDGTPRVHNETVTLNRWRFTDMGDDPTTEHLPTSQIDQFRRVAEATNYFEDWNRRQLTRLSRRLRTRYPRGSDADEIREAILLKLGYDVDLMEFGEDAA